MTCYIQWLLARYRKDVGSTVIPYRYSPAIICQNVVDYSALTSWIDEKQRWEESEKRREEEHHTSTTTPLHYTTITAARHHTTSTLCGWGDWPCDIASIAITPKNNSNHLVVHQWVRSAIPDSQWFTRTKLSYRLPNLETSATALCGTTGSCR